MTIRPAVGETVLLVYRECPCGLWCATGEGGFHPLCHACGKPMLPLGCASGSDGGPMFGADAKDNRRRRGLGFVATFGGEVEALEAVRAQWRATGAEAHRLDAAPPPPYAASGEVDVENTRWAKVA